MTFDIRQVELNKLNTMTKYPSIPTYHILGDKGALQDVVQVPFEGRILGTEKVDGTNCRLIFCPDGSALVGSREDLLWERRDLIAVYYVEVFGRNVGGAAKQYTREGNVGFRLFDAALLSDFEELLSWPAERIAQWRDHGSQPYLDADRLAGAAAEAGFEPVPALFDLDASQLPTVLEETYEFVLGCGASRCKLDESAEGIPEGVVVRNPDRSRIAKLRREDYERTLRRRLGKK